MIKFSKKYNSLFNFILGILGGILISLCIIFISVGNPKELVEFLKNYNIIKRSITEMFQIKNYLKAH